MEGPGPLTSVNRDPELIDGVGGLY